MRKKQGPSSLSRIQPFDRLEARELSERFRHRGYPKRVISTAYQRAKGQDQKSLLSSKKRNQEIQTRFITDFNNNWRQTKNSIKELETKLSNHDEGLVTPFKNKLKDTLDKYETEITQRKSKKFQRDKADFEQGMVYKWKHMGNARRPRNYRGDPLPMALTSSYREESSSDFLSSAGSEVDHGPDGGENTRNAIKRLVRHRGHTPPHRHKYPTRRKKLTFQVMYRRPDILQTIPTDERQTFQDLLELLEENEIDSDRRKFPYRNKSLKTPSFSLVPAIKIFFELVKRDIVAMPIRVSGLSNLNIEEKRALTALQNNRDFTIKEADKGGNVVLWSTQLYEAEAKRQLNNVQYYQKLPSDPTSIFLSKYEQLLHRALQLAIISPQEKQYLWVANPVTATFYMLPKIHKDSTRPPGRPIVSSVGSMCERAGWWEDKFVYSFSLFAAHVHAWYRFIDDVFIIWKGTEEECITFFDNLNSNSYNIFLTYSISAKDITFLDLRVFPHEQHLATNLFQKPTATNALLEFSSFHPWHTKVGVPTGQFLRVRRNCTRDCDFSIQARELSERFRHRGYPKRVISTAYQRAKGQDQKSLLSSKKRNQEIQTRFITDFNNNWRRLPLFVLDLPSLVFQGSFMRGAGIHSSPLCIMPADFWDLYSSCIEDGLIVDFSTGSDVSTKYI
ncbi:unnamed protein product [Ranitomeya imitator]|uniref:Helix-turn-helix domain-containing protein n=1 Tax=Ranitomeya imitator TaxID=111125 RepID=A0ABN9L2E9_9NEOB|nr:unnamed protein product [Ranitomeya imitator]